MNPIVHEDDTVATKATSNKLLGRKKEFLPKKPKSVDFSPLLNLNSLSGNSTDLHRFNVLRSELSNENVYGEVGDYSMPESPCYHCSVGHCKIHSSTGNEARIIEGVARGDMSDVAGPSGFVNRNNLQFQVENNERPECLIENGEKEQHHFAGTTANDNHEKEELLYYADAPKPLEYKLRNKRQRNVYHSITLKSECSYNTSNRPFSMHCQSKRPNPPPVPYKPHYLRLGYSGSLTPPVPPRIVNQEAILQRKQLNEEYFENIRRNVDGDFVEVSEDLPTSSKYITNQSVPNTNVRTSAQTKNMLKKEHPYQTIDSDKSITSKRFSVPLLDNTMEPQAGTKASLSRAQSSGSLNSMCNNINTVKKTSDWMESLKSLKQCGWYWGDMTWEEAEMMLNQRPQEIGLFLLRDSQDPLHILTVTVRTGQDAIRHVRVENTDGKFQLYDPDSTNRGAADCVRHHNIVAFLKLAMKHSQNGNFLYFVRPRNLGEPPVQIQLLSPISRFACVKSLKHYARFVIRDRVPSENIEKLPLPVKLKEYLRRSQYFDQVEELKCASVS